MRILHVADLHLNQRWFEWVASAAPDFDLLVIAGDLQNAFSSLSIAHQARICRDWLLTVEVPTVVVSGNHDYYSKSPNVSVDVFAEAKWLKGLRGKGCIIAADGDTVGFPAQSPEITISTLGWAQKPKWDPDADILVAHAGPAGVSPACDYGGSDLGDSDLWIAMVKNPPPRLVLCGHIHNPRNFWSRWPIENTTARSTILNPGCDEAADAPMRWEIDLNKGRAIHIGSEQGASVSI